MNPSVPTKYRYNELYATDKFDFGDISYNNLMQKRIINVLLICSNYDAFMLEEDGRINEKIFLEYTSKNLRYPPQFTQASSSEKAFELMEKKSFDLVITMLNVGKIDAFEMAKKVKKRYPDIPIVVLTHFSREVTIKLANEDLSSIDYVFCWLGNSSLLLAIIKLIEDKMNAQYDIDEIGVQAILLIEDSIRYYSSYLPTIYKVIFEQTNELMTEGLNEHKKTMRMRARPKILLAKTYEQAIEFYKKYKHNLLGVISDISYYRNGKKDTQAGIKLACKIRAENSQIPILLQSSDEWSDDLMKKIEVTFINKFSKTLLIELKQYIKEHYGFGDFVFKCPGSLEEIDRANNLHSLQVKISSIPSNCLEYHVANNHFSRWLKARALFSIAGLFSEKSTEDFNNIEEIRSYLIDTIANYRINKGRGVIASQIDEYAIFTRLGDGMLGGKARGLAFIDSMIKKHKLMHKWEDIIITIPRTVVLTTDIFDEFMEENHLYKDALSNISDEEILDKFIKAKLPHRIIAPLRELIDVFTIPLAVRSSSLLEDSHYQPFAGVYATYMIANNDPKPENRLHDLEVAIKSVYASVFYKDSKAYITATSNVIDEEKMAVVIQNIAGRTYGNKFYPTLSGVARSVNFYPIAPEQYEDGVANIAFGLGKTIVEGGVSLRFCPKYPQKVLQLSKPELALTDSQKEFYSLNLHVGSFHPSTDESVNLYKLKIKEAENDSAIKYVVSTFDYQDQIIREGLYEGGKKIITFSNLLKHNSFPLAEILSNILEMGKREMNNPVEIEFAVDLDTGDHPQVFHFLQIRPIVEANDKHQVTIVTTNKEETLLYSNKALGNGTINNINNIVYVKPQTFNPAENNTIASYIEQLNQGFQNRNENYILIGPGRWGSSDPWLGIPVKWAQISAARLIVESGLPNYRIDPSQGTHFFQNLTSFSVGYFTINTFIEDGYLDQVYLDELDPIFENNHVRHVKTSIPLTIKIDGRTNQGIIFKTPK